MKAESRLRWQAIERIRSPDSGLFGQGVRFALAGSVVLGVYILMTLVLADVAHLAFQVALAIGFVTAVVTHFTLQRLFVWSHHEEFALRIHAQITRYVAMALVQYGLTAGATSLLPELLGLPTEVVYLTVAVLVTMANFFTFRTRVFHAAEQGPRAEHGQL